MSERSWFRGSSHDGIADSWLRHPAEDNANPEIQTAGRTGMHSANVSNTMPKTEATVRMTLRWKVPSGEDRPIMAALHGLMALIRSEPGCIGCAVSGEMGDAIVLQYVEDWRTQQDLDRHIRSQSFRNLAELMERASERPSATFELPGRIRGLDYADEVRATRARTESVSRPMDS
jgi:quinol monooxygenase YgiN